MVSKKRIVEFCTLYRFAALRNFDLILSLLLQRLEFFSKFSAWLAWLAKLEGVDGCARPRPMHSFLPAIRRDWQDVIATAMEELSSTRFSHLFGANQITFLSCGSLSSVRSTRLRVGLSDRRGCASRPSIRSSPSAWMPGRSLRRDREGAHKGWHGWKVDGCAGPRPMHFLFGSQPSRTDEIAKIGCTRINFPVE